MKDIFNNRTFRTSLTFNNINCSLIINLTNSERRNIKITIPEFSITAVPICFFKEFYNRIEFYIWDSPLLGKCEIIEETGLYYLLFHKVCAVEEKKIQLYEIATISSDICCGEIKEYSFYQDILLNKQYVVNEDRIDYKYVYSHEEYDELTHFFNVERINRLNNDFDKALFIMRILHKAMISTGTTAFVPEKRSGLTLLNAKMNENVQLNCRGCAIVLNDVLLSFGIPSKFIACMSNEPFDPECHVTNSVYIKEFNKWIMLDAATQSYVEGEDGLPLSLYEVHNELLCGKSLKFMISPGVKNTILIKHHFENYLIKNMFCFLSYQKYGPNTDDWHNKNNKYLLLPSNNTTLYTKLNLEDTNTHVTNDPIAFFK